MHACRKQRVTRRRFLQWAGFVVSSGYAVPKVLAQDAFGQALLKGAGSTFVLPLVQQWLKLYRGASVGAEFYSGNTGLESDLLGRAALDYEAIGSLGGLLRLQAKAVDFALSELPLSSQDLARYGLIQIPVVSGGIAIVTHVPGLNGALRLDGVTVAAIYRGRIVRWNDAAIAVLNPGIGLPDEAIQPIHRIEGSGSTYTLTRYLATQDAEWRNSVGVDAVVRWPVGSAVRGSSGVTQALVSTPGSIGYLDRVQAEASGLQLAQLKNRDGYFVTPSAKSVEAATQAVPWQAGQDTQPSFIDAPGEASYPIVATVLALLNGQARSSGDRRARAFLAWALANGQNSARDLGYVALPASLARQVREQLLMPSNSPQ
ncbi:phosphate ABC transporter substrate-binding protein PstS [Pseudomonas sp. NPDC089734]|uniref:phosphate ABC transporter substrate-binding protein PstS n=1 Tax=Pseudomonas sp. NPDC089734 TaxID=3364469 RepID=UPI00380B9968